jgi:hypothetical protein
MAVTFLLHPPQQRIRHKHTKLKSWIAFIVKIEGGSISETSVTSNLED